jgi:hypothetical protein
VFLTSRGTPQTRQNMRRRVLHSAIKQPTRRWPNSASSQSVR